MSTLGGRLTPVPECPTTVDSVENLEIQLKLNFSQTAFLSRMQLNTYACGDMKSCAVISDISYAPHIQ
jgi:hypothetical protein